MKDVNEVQTVEGIHEIVNFVAGSSGLEILNQTDDRVEIFQKTDGKVLTMVTSQVEEVIKRTDSSHQAFLQVNFFNGKKLLLTEKLIGFKPASTFNLDMNKLPRVVTTPDLISVVEAMEDSVGDGEAHPEELKVLQRVYDSVLRGAEEIGFSLPNERTWIKMFNANRIKPSA